MKKSNKKIVNVLIILFIIGIAIFAVVKFNLFGTSQIAYPSGVTPAVYNVYSSGTRSINVCTNANEFCLQSSLSDYSALASLEVWNLFGSPNVFKNGYFIGDVVVKIRNQGGQGTVHVFKNEPWNSQAKCVHPEAGGAVYCPYPVDESFYSSLVGNSYGLTETRILVSPGNKLDWCPSFVSIASPDPYSGKYVEIDYGWYSGCQFNFPVVQCYENADCSKYGTGYACDKSLDWTKWRCLPPLTQTCSEPGKISQFGSSYYLCKDGLWTNVQAILDLNTNDINSLNALLQDKVKIIQQYQGDIAKQGELLNALNATLQEKINIVKSLETEIARQTSLVSQLQLSLNEKIQIVQQLSANIEEQALIINALTTKSNEQAAIIAALNLNVADQAKIIESLSATVDQQAAIIDGLNLNLQQKAALIEQLQLTTNEQKALIDQMKISFADQQSIINQLQGVVSSDVEYIKSLNLTLQQQAEYINSLKLTNEQQAALITQLQINLADLPTLIQDMNLSLQQQAALISSLNLKVEDDAEIIRNLNLSLQDESELVEALNLSLEDDAKIIAELKLSVADQQELIQKLYQNIDDQNKIIQQIKAEQNKIYYQVGIGVAIFIALLVGIILYNRKARHRR